MATSTTILRSQDLPIQITIPETYELSNIILALTPYGKSDPLEVQKNTAYYKEVMAYFGQYANHPLIEEVNYSREEWDKYLSFRTDAYAFEFDDNGDLKRSIKFNAVKGLNEFGDHLSLINDFVKVSGFRQFYREHQPYYDSLLTVYPKSQMLSEMLQFLQEEFGNYVARYAITISPLVGRMNCQRHINGVTMDFVSLPEYQLTGSATIPDKDFAANLHMVFTEMDHAFVNPTTRKYKKLVKKNFTPSRWDKGSGYEDYKFATFNEYMTWAVYDLFVYKYFPQVAQDISVEWARINKQRGFYLSAAFNARLKELYDTRKEGEWIADLYPELLEWCKEFEKTKR